MKIFIGSDHRGFELKSMLKFYLEAAGYEVIDKGAHEYNESDDYPDFIIPVAEAVTGDAEAKGIIIGKSGEGEAICANKVRGIRAVVYYGHEPELLRLTRKDNDANVLSLASGFFLSNEDVKSAVKMWLETPFTNDERHVRRLAKIDQIK
ncbi:RpiB/LacA/LacB family sugar-phosphate isomerase [Candidatus Parcubacteria bacterium]|nr:RpiB/LacA/LacB family sugar-phosphate isomerase [Candidatus Parcubacteria bacterium]